MARCGECTFQGDNIVLPLLIVLAITFIAGVAHGQDNPRPGTTIDAKAVEALQEFSRLTAPLPSPSVMPSKTGNFIQVIRENGQPQLITGINEEAWLMDLCVDTRDGETSREFTIAINELGEFKYVNPYEWTELNSCSVRWVHDPTLGNDFEAIEVMPR